MGNNDLSRRRFFSQLVREGVKLILEIKKKKEESQRAAEFLASFDDYPIAGTYPRELFEGEAKKLGIDIDALGQKEAIKLIIENKMFSKS
jgi:ABC-type proline/glycine betaine transport system ATPase subunit